ncbi:MAG: MATE family efflux transporter [Treponema sp.]|jgi:putative MATE family efflux protein|nr:MATE family efflux transporter [Treponema sp.]
MNTATIVRRGSRRKPAKLIPASITEGPIWKGLLSFFFPILFGTFFQQLYNTVDAIIVGRFIGKEALAAVGGGTGVYVNLLVGFFVGLTSGASVIISQFYGSKKDRYVSQAVHTAIAVAAAGALILTAAGIILSPAAMEIIGTPQDIFELSVVYLRIFFISMVPMFIYNMGAGVQRACGDSKTPLYILIAGCIINIVLDLLFVAVFSWGVRGAAWATVFSQIFSAVFVLYKLEKTKDSYQFRFRQLHVAPHILREMMRIGFPAGIQSALYTVSNLIIQTNINAFGTTTIAAWAAYGRLDSIFWMTSNAFGIALTTFAGQNYGAQKYDRLLEGTKVCLRMAAAAAIGYTVLFSLVGKSLFHLFTTDKEVITDGIKILRFLVPFFITYIPIEVLSGTIRGTGDSFIPMVMTLLGVCFLRIVWLLIAVPINSSLTTVLACYPLTWITTSLLFFLYYKRRKWMKQTVSQS